MPTVLNHVKHEYFRQILRIGSGRRVSIVRQVGGGKPSRPLSPYVY